MIEVLAGEDQQPMAVQGSSGSAQAAGRRGSLRSQSAAAPKPPGSGRRVRDIADPPDRATRAGCSELGGLQEAADVA